jgi:ABC-type Fe3+ transport system permease subunit
VARANGNGSEWGPLLSGLASVATLPLAIYLTRFSDSYELTDAGFAIPVAAALGFVALALARRYRRRQALRLTEEPLPAAVRAGRILGAVGLCLAASALVALAVYGLLEYVGTRD